MHAILETGGKQYRVTSGDVIRVEKLPGAVNDEIKLPAMAILKEGGEVVSGGAVKATIQANGRGDKVLVFKFKRKKQYKKTIGHRQSYTELKVGDLLTGDAATEEVVEHKAAGDATPVESPAAENVAEPKAAGDAAPESPAAEKTE